MSNPEQRARDDVVYTKLFTGVHRNYLRGSIEKTGLDPDDLSESDKSKMDFGIRVGQGWGRLRARLLLAGSLSKCAASTRQARAWSLAAAEQ